MVDVKNPLDEAGTEPTLDKFYGRDPDELTDAEVDELIAAHRAERDQYIAAQDKKEQKREEREEKARSKKAKAAAKAAEAEDAMDKDAT